MDISLNVFFIFLYQNILQLFLSVLILNLGLLGVSLYNLKKNQRKKVETEVKVAEVKFSADDPEDIKNKILKIIAIIGVTAVFFYFT